MMSLLNYPMNYFDKLFQFPIVKKQEACNKKKLELKLF